MAVDSAEVEKKIKALRKKLGQIEKLKEKDGLGDAEKQKVESEPALRAEIAELEACLRSPPAAPAPAAPALAEKPKPAVAEKPKPKPAEAAPAPVAKAKTVAEPPKPKPVEDPQPVPVSGPSPEQEKQIRSIRKKLQQIAKIKEKTSLDAAEKEKLATEPRLLQEVAALERGETLPPLEEVPVPAAKAVDSSPAPATEAPAADDKPKDEYAVSRAQAMMPAPSDIGLLLGDEMEKKWNVTRKKLRDIGKLWEKDKLDKLQLEKMVAEPSLIEEIANIRAKAAAKLDERRNQVAAPRKVDAFKPAPRSGSNAAWECQSCNAEGQPADLEENGGCPKCGSGEIKHFAAARDDDDAEEDDDTIKPEKIKTFGSQDLKTSRQKKGPAEKNVLGSGREEPVATAVTPASARWPEVKEVLESGDNGVDKSRQKKAITVDHVAMEAPYDQFDTTILKCSFLTRMELKLPPGVLAQDSFQCMFPGRLSEGLLELILKENKLVSVPRGIQDLQRIRSIDLSHNDIATLPPAETWEKIAGSLELLDLGFNKLDSISPLEPLAKLSSLKVDSNQLTTLDGVSWKKLRQLMTLTAIGNQIAEIPEAVGECADSLQYLELADNKIVSVPVAVCELKKLKVMSITGNPIKDPKVVNNAEKGLKDLKAYLAKGGPKRKGK